MLVVDASAVAELLLGRPAGDSVARHLREHGFDLHAPHLLDVEVLRALRRVVTARDASPKPAEESVADLADLPIERYGHYELIPRIWELRDNFSTYDATYIALAEAIADDGAPLLTANARLARAADAQTALRVLLAA